MLDRLLAGHYRIVQNLEEGGLAQTYIAEDHHRPGYPKCAVKFLKPASNQPDFLPTARRLFKQEAEILEKLGQNDQIPRLLAYFEENQEFYLVQEFIEGHTLSAELPRGYVWSEDKVIQMLHDVLQTLEFVHSYGVIHRDIKPNNLIRRKKDGRLVLIDFGAVKQVRAPMINDPSALTQYTIAIGTQGYMPTEQVRGKPRLNSDIYALGMIGIQALTGVHPLHFQEDEEGEIIWQDLAAASDELATILSNMVRYHFKDRYRSSAEVLEALQPFVEQSNIVPADLSRSRCELESGSDSGQNQVVLELETALSANSAAVVEPVATKGDLEAKELDLETEIQKTKAIPKFGQSESENWQLWMILSNQFTKFSSWGPVSRARQLSCWRLFSRLLPQGKKLFLTSKLNLLVDHIPQWLQLNKSQLLVGTGITSATIGILTGYTYIDDSHLQTALEEIETLKVAGKYQECSQEAEILAQYYSSLQGKIASLQQQCEAAQAEAQLTAAKQLAAESRLKDAIALAAQVSEDTELYPEATELSAQWSEQILQIASNKYQEGDLSTAIAIAKAVPSDQSVADKVEATIQQWQEDWQQNQTYLVTAQQKLDRGRWQDAINTAQKISKTDYWQEQSQAIIQQARANIAAAQAAAARKTYQPPSHSRASRSRSVPRSNSTSSRLLPNSLRSRSVARPNSTSSSSRSVTSSTYTRSRSVKRSGSTSPRSKSDDWICLNNPNPKCRK
ncbi:MAG: protein kinase [Prochloraceae cyanobacterium]